MAFIAALGALRAHQSWIDVIGNNLANTNTPGFKSSRALFADLLSVTQRQATAPSGSVGGTNPLQVGLGTQLASVDRQMGQGALDATGRTFDLALLGSGFFALTDGIETQYTRVGTFGLDGNGDMVDLRTGSRVLNSNGSTFSIDVRAVLPPSATSIMGFSGNLPAVKTGPLAEELTSSSGYVSGTQATMTGSISGNFTVPPGETWTLEFVVNGGAPQEVSIAGTGADLSAADIVNAINAQTEDFVASVNGSSVQLTSDRSGEASSVQVIAGQAGKDLKSLLGLGDFVRGSETSAIATTSLNDLTNNVRNYDPGDEINISGTDVDGSPVIAAFNFGSTAAGFDGTTVGELAAFIDARFAQADIAFDPSTGRIRVTAKSAGEAQLSLSIVDGVNQTGSSDWASSFFATTTNGAGPDRVTTSNEVFDSGGTAHVVTFEFVRQEDDTWNLEVSMPASAGKVNSGTITGISFNENGSLQAGGSAQIDLEFAGLSQQSVSISLGSQGLFDGLTQFGGPATVITDSQDGFSSGELASLDVLADGSIEGFYTNGQTKSLGNFGVATFTNQQALEDIGNSYFRASANTGARVLGSGNSNAAGEIVSGALETSNVDTAEEFVRLIQAQRGFQANARVVTVQDELLQEVVNIV